MFSFYKPVLGTPVAAPDNVYTRPSKLHDHHNYAEPRLPAKGRY